MSCRATTGRKRMDDVPDGWTIVSFEDVVQVNPRKSSGMEGDMRVSFVPMAAVSEVSGSIASAVPRPWREVSRGFRQFQNGDVIFAKITPSMENGKAAVAYGLHNGVGCGSTEFHVLRSHGAVLPEYLWRFIRQPSFRRDARRVMTGAVGQQRVPAGYIRRHRLPLPPLREQRRIVEKIQSLLVSVDDARKALGRVGVMLGEYKERVLDSAFAGHLTDDFRGGRVSRGAANTGYPSGWSIKALGDISEIQTGIQVGRRRLATAELMEVPYLRVANVQRGWLDLEDVKSIAVTRAERERLLLRQGDVLMNEGGDRDKLGRGWVWQGEIAGCVHQNHVFRVRLNDGLFPPHFVSYYANHRGQKYFFEKGKQTTNLASVSKRSLAALPVPLPPVDEAIAIVDRIGSVMAWADRVADEQLAAEELLNKLESGVLASAFAGELLAQDPSDEPAPAFLARVRSGRPAPVERGRRASAERKEINVMLRTMLEVLSEADGWIEGHEAFRRCGAVDGAATELIEMLYAELRELDKAGRLEVQTVRDDTGRKAGDRLRLREG